MLQNARDDTQKGLTGNALKLIAIVAMTVDHLAWLLLPGYRIDALTLGLHVIGRLTAPIMMYFIVEGYYYTKNLKKYILRMAVFALVSHFAYALMFGKDTIPFQRTVFDQTSVLWAYLMGLIALAVTKSDDARLKPWLRHLIVWACLAAAFCADWSTPAAGAILFMGIYRGDFKKQMWYMMAFISTYAIVYVVFLNPVYGVLQLCVALAIPLLRSYNGRQGKGRWMKWFFYIYYPAHLFILGLIRVFVLQ